MASLSGRGCCPRTRTEVLESDLNLGPQEKYGKFCEVNTQDYKDPKFHVLGAKKKCGFNSQCEIISTAILDSASEDMIAGTLLNQA